MHEDDNCDFESDWIKFVKNSLNNLGLGNLWNDPNTKFLNKEWFKEKNKLTLSDQSMQVWSADVWSHPRCKNYRIFKHIPQIEPYIQNLSTYYIRVLAKFRCGSNNIPVNCDVFRSNESNNNRICTLCKCQEVGVEYHYIMTCDAFKKQRARLLNEALISRPSTIKFEQIFNSNDAASQRNLAIFCKTVMDAFDSPITETREGIFLKKEKISRFGRKIKSTTQTSVYIY
jgi:hypothetical protein